MENNELVEESTENTEAQTVEEIEDVETEDDAEETETPVEEESAEEEVENEKKYTDDELEEIVGRKLSRQKRKLEREYKKKYSELETVLNAGLGTNNVEESTEKLKEFYKEEGVEIPEVNGYTDEDLELIAEAEADRFIRESTYDELVEETEELASIPVEQLTERDKLVFMKLADERKRQEEEKAILSLGISKDTLNEKDFLDFTKKLNPELSIKEKYELYLSTKPKQETRKMGSMKSGAQSKVKDFYTEEEISRLTEEDLDDPKVWEAVRKSMTGE